MYELNGNTDHVRRLAELRIQENIARAARYRARRSARMGGADTERRLAPGRDGSLPSAGPTVLERLTSSLRRLGLTLTRG